MKEDIIFYPPMLSIINILVELGYQVYHIGVYSDADNKKRLERLGVVFLTTLQYNGKGNLFVKFVQQISLRKQIKSYLAQCKVSKKDLLWIFQIETICLLHSIVKQYRCILQMFEFQDPKINWKYKFFAPSFSLRTTLKEAHKVVCCEYNRAQITKGLLDLEECPYVLPNKPYIDENVLKNIPADIQHLLDNLTKKLIGKRVILYQGVFQNKERRLEEFCEAIKNMSEEYVLIAMGKGTDYYERLRNRYESDRIIFMPFIRPPYHLLVTKMASIGVLSYYPTSQKMSSVINPLYCAPNKTFEYSKYGKPMLSNDVPALYYTYTIYHCGRCISYPMTSSKISEAILSIFNNYEEYSKGALEYYKSVDIKHIVKSIVEG